MIDKKLKMDYKKEALKLIYKEIEGFDELDEKSRQYLLSLKMENLKYQHHEEKAKQRKKSAKQYIKTFSLVDEPKRLGLLNFKRGLTEAMYYEQSSEFLKNTSSYNGLNIRLFNKEDIFKFKNDIIKIIDESESYEDVYRLPMSYMYFKIYNKGEIIASTKACSLEKDTFEEDVDDLYKTLYSMLDEIVKRVYGYEALFTTETYSYIVFHVKSMYFPNPSCVSNWGKDLPKVINCGVFKIFTANDVNTSCITQCSQYVCNKEIDTLDGLIEEYNGNVCILTPQSYIKNIKHIKSYSDIRLFPSSPIKSLSIIDPAIVYLIIFKEHIGVIFDMTKPKYNRSVTTFSPLEKYIKSKDITVCFDIEAYFDPEDDVNQTNIPYLCCACIIYNNEIGNVVDFEGRDCVAQMIEYLVDVCSELNVKSVELIAHNGGAYDFHYILSSMFDPSIIQNILIRNNNFISFNFKHDNVKFYVKDSYSFLLCSLARAAQAFLTDNKDLRKTDFPHHVVKTQDDLYKVYKKWRSIDQDINVSVEKEKLLITSENIINYEVDGESRKLIDWSKDYCRNDVIVLSKVWIEFKQAVNDIFGSNVVDKSLTLAGLSFHLFKAHIDTSVELRHPNKEDYFNMRESLIGGRCVSINGIYEKIHCLDVKSLYPAAMAFYDQPYGNFKRVKERIKSELGIYYVKVTPCKYPKSNFFPIRFNNKIMYSNYGDKQYFGWYTTVDIDIGISEGHRIEYVPFDEDDNIGYSWAKKGRIFQKYIENVLYKLKLQYEQENNKVKRNVVKIIMNSLWGKFAQKWIDTDYMIKIDSDIDFNLENASQIWNTDFMLVKAIKKDQYSSKPIQNGIFTLSWARFHMKEIWDAGAINNAECIYSDTDSIFVRENSFDLNASFKLNGEYVKVIGEEIGQLELECTFNKLLCVGKKQYMGYYQYIDEDGNPEVLEKKRFKGIPAPFIIPELYTHLIQNGVANIKFLKFRREWGSVKGYIESKNIKAT